MRSKTGDQVRWELLEISKPNLDRWDIESA